MLNYYRKIYKKLIKGEMIEIMGEYDNSTYDRCRKEHIDYFKEKGIIVKDIELYRENKYLGEEIKITIPKTICPICNNMVDRVTHGKIKKCNRCHNYLLNFGGCLYVGLREE